MLYCVGERGHDSTARLPREQTRLMATRMRFLDAEPSVPGEREDPEYRVNDGGRDAHRLERNALRSTLGE
jgi:hypothetical protein